MYKLAILDHEDEEFYTGDLTAEEVLKLMKVIFELESDAEVPDVRPAPSKPTKTTAKKVGHACSICRTPGHTARTCPQAGHVPASNKPLGSPLSQEMYEEVKTCKMEGMRAPAVAENLEVSGEEVNVAWGAASYQEYLAARKTMHKV